MLQASELTCGVQLNPGGSMFLLKFGTTQQKRQPSTVMNTSVNKIVSSFKCSLPIDFSDQIFYYFSVYPCVVYATLIIFVETNI